MTTFRLTLFYIRTSWQPRTLFFLLAMLLLSGFILGGMPHMADEPARLLFQPVRLSIVDDDRSLISQLLIAELSDIDMIDKVYLDTLPEARRRLAAADTAMIVVIPTGFFEQTAYSLERSPLLVYHSDVMPAETAILSRLFNHLAEGISTVQSAFFAYREFARPLYDDDQDFYKALDAAFLRLFFKMFGRKAFTGITDSSPLQPGAFFTSAMVCLLTLLSALLCLLQVQQDRRSHLQLRFYAAGVSWFSCMLARQLAGLTWLATGFAPLLAGLSVLLPQTDLIRTIAAILLLYWTGAALFQAWGQMGAPGDEKLLGAWLALLFLLLLGGSIYPSALLPDQLQRLSPFSPVWFAFNMIYDAATGRHYALPWVAWLAHLAFATLLVWLSGAKLRRRGHPFGEADMS